MKCRRVESLSESMMGRFAVILWMVAALLGVNFSVVAHADALPDHRAYEMVSPVEKEGADVEAAGYDGAGISAIDGERFAFNSRGSFAGQPTALAAEASPYLATRGPGGWTTVGVALPNGSLSFESDGYMGFDPELSKGVIGWLETTRFGSYDPLAQRGYNVYMYDSEEASFELLNGTVSALNNDEGFKWGSSDFGKLALDTDHPLSSAVGPCSIAHRSCAWEWDHGYLRLASVLPDGEPVNGMAGDSPESLSTAHYFCNFEHAVSDDGTRLFFTVQGGEAASQLYVREDGTSSTLLSGSERTLPGGVSGLRVDYQSAEAAHGNRVLFTTRNSLVDADTNEAKDLYMYDFTKPAGERLTLISEDNNPEAPEGAEIDGGEKHCGGFVGASEDLRRVYFVADNQIVAGAPADPGPKLYLWEEGDTGSHVTYIATLNAGAPDWRVWAAPALDVRKSGVPRQSRWSRDGRYLAFISNASLTGFDNKGEEEIYRFDAVSKSLVCVTCVSDAVPAQGEVAFQPTRHSIKPANHLPVNVTDQGQVLFQTTRGLVLGDSNGQSDVYEYDGELHLISKGTGSQPSSFLDATPTGSDVFFATSDRLVGWDTDGNVDVYDARVGGGFPEPSSTPPACEGEGCLASPAVSADATPSSFTFSGAGNPVAAPAISCKTGFVRVKSVCRKKVAAKRKPAKKKRAKRRRQRKHTARGRG
jgi:hypothetical protein